MLKGPRHLPFEKHRLKSQASEIAEKVVQIASFGRGSESATRKISRLAEPRPQGAILSTGFSAISSADERLFQRPKLHRNARAPEFV
jgi:hypothetical protein